MLNPQKFPDPYTPAEPDPPVNDTVGMILQGSDGSIQACNTAAESILGFTFAQMRGCHYIDCPWQTIHADGSPFPGTAHPPMLALQSGQPVTGQIMGIYQPNGDLVWLQIDAQPLFQGPGSAPWGVVTTFVEITQSTCSPKFCNHGCLLAQMTERISGPQNLADILQITVTEVRQVLQADRVFIFRFLPNWSGEVVAESVGAGWRSVLASKVEDTYFQQTGGEAYRQGRIQAIADVQAADLSDCHLTLLTLFQVRANLVIPIVRAEQLWGLLVVNQCASPRHWLPLDIQLLQQLVKQVSMAMGQAELYGQLRGELARQHQVITALQESEARYQRRWEAVPGLLFTALPDGWSDYCNPHFYQFTGMTADAARGWGWITAVYPEDRERLRENWLNALRQGKPFEMAYRLRRADGEYRWFLGRSIPLQEETDQISQWLGICTEIHELKETQVALSQSEAQFRLLTEHLPETVFWVTDPQTERILYVSPAYERLWGQPRDRLYSHPQSWLDMIHPEDRPRIQTAYAAQTHTGSYDEEYRILHPDGHLAWVRDRRFAIPKATGEVDRLVGLTENITARKRSEIDLRQSEAKFRRLVEISMFGVAIGDFSGRMTYANAALLKMIGYSREELEAGQIRWIDLTPPEHLPLDWQAGEELRQFGVSTPFEKEYMHKDGHRVPILIGGALLGEPYVDQELIIAFYLDLSGIKQTEHQLRAALQQLNFHVENTPMAVIEWDAQFIVRRWSGAAPQIFGWPAEEILGRCINELNLVYEEDLAEVTAVCDRILSGAEPQIIAHNRNYKKDGSVLHCVWYNSTLTDPMGQVTSILSLVLDRTEQVRAEESLRQSEERFRLAARAVTGMVYDWNVATQEVYRSEGLYGLIGVHPEEVPPTQAWWSEQIHPEDLVHLYPQMQVIMAGQGDSYDFEYRVRHRDGHWVNFWDRGYLIRNSQGQVIRVVGSSTDITLRKQLEQQRENLLIQEQTAREQAELANRMKDEFLAVLSHELRTPLNPILGWCKLLQTRPFDPPRSMEALRTIERNAQLQVQLIEDLLDFSTIVQGKLPLQIAPVHLSSIITAALESVRLAAEAKTIQLQTCLDQNPILVWGDANRLQQVVWNLLSNAIKFTPEGGQVEVRLESGEGSPGQRAHSMPVNTFSHAQICVIDTGKGITSDFLPHVFDYFRQEDGAMTRRYGGLGLGLAIVKQIVEMHGGRIWAESPGLGEGATFTVRLPLMKEEQPWNHVAEPSLPPPQPASPTYPLKDLHLLIVDDQPDSQDFLAFCLREEQAIVTTVSSAPEALQVLAQSRPDLLISDIGIPQIDGYMLIAQIRTQLGLSPRQLPAIALTAFAEEVDQQQVLQSGFQIHLAKPIDPDHLVQAISQLCRPQPTPSA